SVEITDGDYTTGGDIQINRKCELLISAGAVVRLGDNAVIDNHRVNRQDSARRTGIFVFEPGSSGSTLVCHVLLDANQVGQPEDGAGRNTATSGVFVWNARVTFKGEIYNQGGSSGLHLIDADYSTFETIIAEADVDGGSEEGLTVLALEGCRHVTGKKVV